MADEPTTTQPPALQEGTGFTMHGLYPLNHRLRAQAIAKARRKSDPDGLISDDEIAAASDQLARDREAEKATTATTTTEKGA